MNILLFIIVLVILIVVHEFGHLIAAKIFKMRVDEFGIGYPPKALTFHRSGGTDYTLNWLPFGGFVKIHGEDGDTAPGSDSFVVKPKWQQAIVLVAGIAMNLVFAYLVFVVALASGMPRVVDGTDVPPDARIVVSRVLADSPADDAGLVPGDIITGAYVDGNELDLTTAEAFTAFVAESDAGLGLSVLRGEETLLISARAETGVIANDPERLALGVGVSTISSAPVPWWRAPIDAFSFTVAATGAIGAGLAHFFGSLLTFSADLSQVSGPVGIVGAVGDASASGFVALLSLTAVISINLALVNLLPVPALDGGRLLFVLIEAVIRRPIPAGVSGAVNTIGFALLILLMLVITASDIWKLFA